MAARRDTSALFDVPRGRRGRVETALEKAIRAARRESLLSEVDAAAVTLARAQARAVDVAEAARELWALARVGGELRESLIRLRLDPVSRGAARGELAGFLADLGRPDAGAAEVGDSP